MTTLAAIFCLLLLSIGANAAPPLALTLPSADTYCYWMQTKSGPVGTMPVTVTHKQTVRIAAPMTTGDRLFVMDAHTGEVASHRVSIGLSGAPLPISLALADFHPVSAPPPPAPLAAPMQAVPEDAPPRGVQRLLTGLFSLLLAGGVGWVVLSLVRTRGEPLRHFARRLGVEVADPAGPEEEAPNAEPPVFTPEKRVPEAIPDEAVLPPRHESGSPRPEEAPLTAVRIGRGPALALSEIPALLGLQGLAAGSTFALTGGDVTVGRDGDNEIVLADNTVSRRHARLLQDSQGQFTVTDLGSANGVYINGTRIQRAILATGDEIKIGDNYFRFQAAKGTL